MNFLSPTRSPRLNEAVGILLLLLSLAGWLGLLSYSSTDPSWNTATGVKHAHNLLGLFGAKWSDLLLQIFGISIFLLPLHTALLGWKWVRSSAVESPWFRVCGSLALWFCVSTACGLAPRHWLIGGTIRPSGLTGLVLADFLRAHFNVAGAAIITLASAVIALYFATTFEMATLMRWFAGPIAKWHAIVEKWHAARAARRARAVEAAKARAAERVARRRAERAAQMQQRSVPVEPVRPVSPEPPPVVDDAPPFDMPAPVEDFAEPSEPAEEIEQDIPIRSLADQLEDIAPQSIDQPAILSRHADTPPAPSRKRVYRLPTTDLLNEPPPGNGYDSLELKDVAGRIKSKLDEFNVRGSVVQINPGPVVTTFEYKPEAGVKYSRITTLTEDLCLGLQAESVLIERLPGKSTVGIEVPNSRREVISLRQVLESSEFTDSPSKMTMR